MSVGLFRLLVDGLMKKLRSTDEVELQNNTQSGGVIFDALVNLGADFVMGARHDIPAQAREIC